MIAQQIDSASELAVEASSRAPSAPRAIMLTRWRAILIITIAHLATAAGARVLFDYVEYTRGYDDARNDQVTIAFAVVIGISWLISMFLLMRRSAEEVPAESIRFR